MKQLFFLVSLILLQATLLPAQKIVQIANAAAGGFSSNRLERIDNAMNEWVQKEWMNGAVAMIVHDGKIVYHKAAGYNDLASKTPLQKDGIFRIASQTKAITSVAIMMLFEEGKLLLDDPISKYIPTFNKQVVLDKFNSADTTYTSVPSKKDITIRDLLTHTSGIGYAQIGSKEANAIYAKNNITSGLGVTNSTLLDAMTRLGKLPLMHQPGEKFTYGLNSDLLGCIVEVVSGLSLEAYCQKKIFDPLGMKDTYFNVPMSKAERLPTVYTEDDSNKIIEWSPTFRDINPNYPIIPKTYFSGGAGLSSTAYDYAIFLQMILNGGKYNGKQIIAPRTAEIMTSPQLDFKFNGQDDFSLGFGITSEKSANLNFRNKGSFSWGGYYGTSYWADPKDKLVVLIMTQHNPNSHGELGGIIERIIYGSRVN